LENVQALLVPNSLAATTETEPTAEEFMRAQEKINKPMVIFIDKQTNEYIKHYCIAAETMEELALMFKLKYFDTTTLPELEYKVFKGCYFVGVGKTSENKKATVLVTP
jgi:aspartyl/asparaginyl-tRNA synthetase